jgi:hypothetical protein
MTLSSAGQDDGQEDRRRGIGPIGTGARVCVGLLLTGIVFLSLLTSSGSWLSPLALGLVGFPALLLASQWLRALRDPSRLQATGPLGTTLNMVLFAALFLTPWYARPLSVTSDAALVFYGASMLLAALRGYGGCEVLAFSNWVLRRDDQVGCLVFGPIDGMEQRRRP